MLRWWGRVCEFWGRGGGTRGPWDQDARPEPNQRNGVGSFCVFVARFHVHVRVWVRSLGEGRGAAFLGCNFEYILLTLVSSEKCRILCVSRVDFGIRFTVQWDTTIAVDLSTNSLLMIFITLYRVFKTYFDFYLT